MGNKVFTYLLTMDAPLFHSFLQITRLPPMSLFEDETGVKLIIIIIIIINWQCS